MPPLHNTPPCLFTWRFAGIITQPWSLGGFLFTQKHCFSFYCSFFLLFTNNFLRNSFSLDAYYFFLLFFPMFCFHFHFPFICAFTFTCTFSLMFFIDNFFFFPFFVSLFRFLYFILVPRVFFFFNYFHLFCVI